MGDVSGLTGCAWIPGGACRRMPERHAATAEELTRARRKVQALMAEVEDPDAMDADGGGEEGEETEGAAAAAGAPAAAGAATAAGDEAGEDEGGEDDEEEEDDESDGSGVELGLPSQGQDGVAGVESDDESEVDNLEIRETDAVFVCCHQRASGQAALEVYVYDDPRDHVYLHHDVQLPGIPLSVAWHAAGPGKEGGGSYAAVGTFLPFIEVWDLDVLDAPEPALLLGGCKRRDENYATRKFKPKQLRKGSHKDAILSVRWNPGVPKVLASGSADTAVKLWDLVSGECLDTLQHHSAPVQALAWCPQQPQALCSGGFDGALVVSDCRTQQAAARWKVKKTPEAVVWSAHEQHTLWATLETGELLQLDARAAAKPVWRAAAHTGEAAGLAANPVVPGLLATAGVDRQVKLWDVRTEPTCLSSRDVGQGRVFSMSFSADRPTLLLAAGDQGKPLVYCVRDDVASAFTVR